MTTTNDPASMAALIAAIFTSELRNERRVDSTVYPYVTRAEAQRLADEFPHITLTWWSEKTGPGTATAAWRLTITEEI